MAIEFTCRNCRGRLRVASEYGGRLGRCPFCRKLINVPTASEAMDEPAEKVDDSVMASILAEAAAEPRDLAPDLGPEREALPAKEPERRKTPLPSSVPRGTKGAIEFECLLCGEKISVGKEMAGKKISCPGCREQLAVPSS